LRSRGNDSAYFVPSADRGLLFNLVIAPVLRVGFKRVWLHHHVSRYFKQHDWRLSLFLRIIGSKVSHITLSREMSADLRTQYGDCESISISNAAFMREAILDVETDQQLKSVGFIGNVSEEKGILKFIEVIERLDELGMETNAIIAGPCSTPDVSRRVTAFVRKSPNTRRYLGPVSGDAKAKFFSDADAILFPSDYVNEAQPMVIFEALALGIPVLATKAGYITEQLKGTHWSIDQDTYIVEVTEQIKSWIEDADSFQKSRHKALTVFSSAKRASEEQLLHWITENA